MEVRNLHTFMTDEFDNMGLVSVDPVGVVNTGVAQNWGLYQGSPAVRVSGDMNVWKPGGDPEDSYAASFVTSTGCQIWYAAGDVQWYRHKTVQVGLLYDGDDIGEVLVALTGDSNGNGGYYVVYVTYPSKMPAPQVVWLVGATYEKQDFWTNFVLSSGTP